MRTYHLFSPRTVLSSLLALCIFWTFNSRHPSRSASSLDDTTPLVAQYIGNGLGHGGRWYIPKDWWYLNHPDSTRQMYGSKISDLRTPAEAAHLALELSMRSRSYMRNSKIPLIVHQTWKTSNSSTWNQLSRDSAEAWLRLATGASESELPEFAYIFWDDQAVDEMIAHYEPTIWPDFKEHYHPVVKSDIFRVVVVRWFGGVYADIDTTPLQHPSLWVQDGDLTAWKDPSTERSFTLHETVAKSYVAPKSAPPRPNSRLSNYHAGGPPTAYAQMMQDYAPNSIDVGAIVGLEADGDPDGDAYWRSGYFYAQQLTNWAFAMAPQHPVASRYLAQVHSDTIANMSHLSHLYPITFSGPAALTRTVKAFAEDETADLIWHTLSGLKEARGGRGKIVAGDVLVLPITGFSPGRARKWFNEGSEPYDHPNARLAHAFQGSWRHKTFRVEFGKFCRTVFGACRDWPMYP